MREISVTEALGWRLRAQHLDAPLGPGALAEAAGACGFQNTPPGAWELAAINRVQDITAAALREALYVDKSLLQAWSLRGAPYVFPTAEAAAFLSPLAAQPGEEPWIYTRGITAALDYLGMDFYELLPAVMDAARLLETREVRSKEELDRVLAAAAERAVPPEKLPLWRAGTMYGDPAKQSVGGAVVSFMLRPCAFAGLVVFGERRGAEPEFASPLRWLGHGLEPMSGGAAELVRKFLHCYAPASVRELADWLGCSPAQAQRLWAEVEPELEPVRFGGQVKYALASDAGDIPGSAPGGGPLLLGPHDPYLDSRERDIIAPDVKAQRAIWRYSGNPGVVLRGGVAAGIWRGRVSGGAISVAVEPFAHLTGPERRALAALAEHQAAARGLAVRAFEVRE